MSLAEIKDRIAAAELQSNRAPGGARLIAVSKVQPPARIEAVLQEGHRIYGENRVQEAQGKWPAWKESFEGVELHLLGPLQTNKARAALELFDVLHTLDRPKLAKTLARLAQELGACPPMFVQVNTGEEPQKAGVLPVEVDGFVDECRAMDLPVIGLMCIPPVDEEPALHFSLLAKMAERNGLTRLSMGMSADYELAVRLGATDVRVGSAIFGARTTTG